MSIKKQGRPERKESREEMDVITFRADAATKAAIEKLEAEMKLEAPIGIAVGALKAAAIRRGLQLAAGMLDRESGVTKKL